MKTLIASTVSILALLSNSSAYAGAYIPVEYANTICIERSFYSLSEVMSLVLEDVKTSSQDKGCIPKTDIDKFSKLEIKNLNHGCPFGHQFEYHLLAQCYLP